MAETPVPRTTSRAPAGTGSVTLDELTARNVRSVLEMEQAELEKRSAADRAADAITAFCGSMWFVWTHVVWFGLWIALNLVPRVAFDPFPFSFLTLVVSLEAIFLSTFILISENRQARIADRRNLLDLQIDLLAEQENTKQLTLLTRIAAKVGVELDDEEAAALAETTRCDQVADQIDQRLEDTANGAKR